MQIVRSLQQLEPASPTILTIGNYDGVHLGHQHVISAVVQRARALGAQSAVMTFDPHTDQVLKPERQRRLLTSIDERATLIEQLGVDMLIIMPFDQSLAALSAETFMQLVTRHINLRELCDGPDFRLGHKAQGTMAVLAEIGERLGYSVHAVEPFLLNAERISSTRLRELIEDGQVAAARELLGRSFAIEGRVVEGDKRGRTIGFPTANLAVPADHVIPANGVYVCRAALRDEARSNLRAVVNIGVRPTFGELSRTIEAHLLGFSGDLYGRRLRLSFLARLRDEQKFAGVDALIAQIKADVARTEELLDSSEHA